MRRGITVHFLLFIAVILSGYSPALLGQEATWVTLERGKRALRHGEYADALSAFREVREREPANAEAARYIGIVFEENGDLRQALRYYERAIESAPFEIPDTLAEVHYSRARIFERQRDYGRYEREMSRLFDLDEWFSSEEYATRRENQIRVVRQESLSRALVLYRLEASVFADPHRDYGEYLVRAGRFAEATPHLVRSAIETFSHVIEEYLLMRREYEFVRLDRHLDAIEDRPQLLSFLERREIWRVTYYLATALYFEGYSTRGRELWHFVASRPEAGDWANMAAAQLQEPEPPSLP